MDEKIYVHPVVERVVLCCAGYLVPTCAHVYIHAYIHTYTCRQIVQRQDEASMRKAHCIG